jgi:hypothetical protein
MKPDPAHPRMGVPDDKMGMYAIPLQERAPDTGEIRQAIVVIVYPPTALRDAPREVIEVFVAARKRGILASIVDEIYRSYTSDPVDAASTRNIAEALTRHADSMRR